MNNVTVKISEMLVSVTCQYCRKVNTVFETVSDKIVLVPCQYCKKPINIADIVTGKVSSVTQEVSETLVSVRKPFDVTWVNGLLRIGVEVCKKRYDYGTLDNRIFEVKCYIRMLREKGYVLQAKKLGDWLFVLYRNHRDVKREVKCTEPEKKVIGTWKEWLDWLYKY